MADIVVNVLMEDIAGLLGQEYEMSLGGVVPEVKTLEKDLDIINSFLKNSEAKRNEKDEVQRVIDGIRDEVQHVEDVVDAYMANAIELKRRNPLLRKLCLLFGRRKKLRGAGNKIKSIRNTINLIYNNKHRYGIFQEADLEVSSRFDNDESSLKDNTTLPQQEEDEAERWWRKNVAECVEESSIVLDKSPVPLKETSPPQQEEDHNRFRWQRHNDINDVVGFDSETTALVRQLIDGDPRLDVVSIIGMDGSGKTTLVSKIYNDVRVKNHFDCHAWIFASQKYSIKDFYFTILMCLVSSIPEEMRKMSNEELKLTIRAFLREKRYLVVMDDVRTTQLWDEVREAFPNSFNGSRLLITCNKQVTLFASQNPPYSLSPLDFDTSWQLFSKKVFTRTYECPPDLAAPAKKLVESCKGVPLSIVVLAGFLANKEKTYETWSELFNFVNFNYSQNTRSSDILSLSYNHLPRNLKSCFLYFAAFPIDFVISAKYLIKLWLAEGLIQRTKNKNGEDVAENYLEELINRSFIQVINRRTDGGAKTCHIHDLLRDIFISESVREKFLEAHLEANPASISKSRRSLSQVPNRRVMICTRFLHLLREVIISKFLEVRSAPMSKARRLSIQGNISQYISSHPHVPFRARSLLLFGEGNDFSIKHWKWIYKNFKFLRVLCLEKVYVTSIPRHIKKLIFLRHLRIWSKKMFRFDSIPASICNLQYLETIDVSGRVQNCLPKGIWMMKRLRHLNFSAGMNFPETMIDTSSSNVQVLTCIIVDGKSVHQMLRFGFPNLRKLHLKYDDESTQMNEFELADVLESLNYLTQLENLKILEFPTSEPRSNLFPSTLVKITFQRSYFNSTHFGILAKLPNLEILKLKGKFPYYGILGPLTCVAGDFPKLKVFQMIDLEIGIWVLESGAMELLERLVIRECYHLRNVPKELINLSSLRHVEVSQMTQSFTKMLKELGCGVQCELLIDSMQL